MLTDVAACDVPERPSLSRELSESMFTCCICYDVLVDPTTLTCGHNVCRLCLASWYSQSNRRECPECRQLWTGYPKINIALRSMTERLFVEKVRQRRIDIGASESKLEWFERKLSEESQPLNSSAQRMPTLIAFFKGIICTVVAIVILWLLGGSGDDSITRKPVSKWSVNDVSIWLSELGPWTEDHLVPFFVERNIDGSILLMMDESDLSMFFNETSAMYMKAFNISLHRLQTVGVKTPQSIWDYKRLYLGRAILLSYSLQYNPRTTFLLFFMLDYSDTFLPFAHSVTLNSASELAPFYDLQSLHGGLSIREWLHFITLSLLLPYLLILRYVHMHASWMGWVTGKLLIADCSLLTLLEVGTLWRVFKRTHAPISICQQTRLEMRHYMAELRSYVLPILLWQFIPTFIGNTAFLMAIYITPFSHMHRLRKVIRRELLRR